MTAFCGCDGDDPRLGILKSLTSLDVEACPGSGKTTLLVAKLAILAREWKVPRRGLCVLSHSNVARSEIEQRLGAAAEGRKLLSYPHYVGTIHGFVNEFIATPWLRSKGFPIERIDDEIALERRWRRLSRAIRSGLENNNMDRNVLRYRNAFFDLGEIRWGRGTLGNDTPTYRALRDACLVSTQEGYYCYDEMFVWADELLDREPEVANLIRTRFPILFIDEVQDNSEMQSRMLHRVFVAGSQPVIRQRFGDANQAIYHSTAQSEGAVTDTFPAATVRAGISNSFRFDQSIADLADPLALQPHGLQGKRPPLAEYASNASDQHAIFLFNDGSIDAILSAYAAHLVAVFSHAELQRGTFTAIGAVHRPGPDDNVPRSVGRYWHDYNHETGRSDPQPKTFVEYVFAGRRLSKASGQTVMLVEKIAEAVIRLARIVNPNVNSGSRKRKHRYVLTLFGEDADARARYIDLTRNIAVGCAVLAESDWIEKWRAAVVHVAGAIANVQISGNDVENFLAWSDSEGGGQSNAIRGLSDNIFRFPRIDPAVAIRVGSIHSAKGETHTATLVLETFYRAHHLKKLKPWLLGQKSSGANVDLSLQSRLKLHYVAMTRPTHMLCLAMREDAFTEGEITQLRGRRWRVARVGDGVTTWL